MENSRFLMRMTPKQKKLISIIFLSDKLHIFEIRQEKEDKRLKWILNANITVKRAFLFTLQYNCASDAIVTVKRINESDINGLLRIAFRAKMECKKTQEQITKELGLNRAVNAEDYMLYFQSKEAVICKYWRFPPPAELEEWNECKRIGVVGSSGKGKSTIIRSLLSVLGDAEHNRYKGKPLKDIDVNIDIKEATFEVVEYDLMAKVKLIDFPGAGTPRISEGLRGIDYIRNFHILYYSVIIIVTCGRFHELDLELANICNMNNVKFIFVRTKFDRDVQEQYRNSEEDEIDDFSVFVHQIQKRLKAEFYSLLKGFKAPLYFINGLRLRDYSFPQLLKNIEKILNNADALKAFELPQLEDYNASEETFFDLLAAGGDIFQNAVDELRMLGTEVADLNNLTSGDILKLDAIDCDKTSDLVQSQIQRLLQRHGKYYLSIKDTCIQNPPQDKLRNSCMRLKKAIKGLFDGIYRKKAASLDRIAGIILEYIAVFEVVRLWSKEEVGQKIAEFGPNFQCCVAPLCISGEILLNSSNDTLLQMIQNSNIQLHPITKKLLCRKLDRLRGVYESEENDATKPKILEPAARQEKPFEIPTFHRQAKKLAAVFSVTKGRKSTVVLNEVRGLEKALVYAGYDLWFYGGRESTESFPVTAKKEDFGAFAKYFNQKKEELKLQGVFIFMTGHGWTDVKNGEERPLIEAHNGDALDIFSYFEKFGDNDFPVIFTINCCRIYEDDRKKFKINAFDLPDNVFAMWGASLGKTAEEGRLTEEWRRTLYDPLFFEEPISVIAAKVKKSCGGRNNDSLVSDYPCFGGIFDTTKEE